MLILMYARAELQARDDQPREDHIVHLSGVTWADYERLLEIRGDKSAPRLTYLEGALEIMSPSRDHETIKSLIGRLVEAYCLERGIRFTPVGSWTLKERNEERGAEPDECYVFGTEPADRPDLAIEVIWTSGRLDKLDVYRKLGVTEVWYWRKGQVQPYALRGERYEAIAASEVLPGLDLALLAEHIDRPTAYDAITDFRAALSRLDRRR
jgi:Uma2 family endonuclease